MSERAPLTYRGAALLGGSLALGGSIIGYTMFRGFMGRSGIEPSFPSLILELFALGPLVASPVVGAALGVGALAVARMQRKQQIAIGIGTNAGFVLGIAYTIGVTGSFPVGLACVAVVPATVTLYLWQQERRCGRQHKD